MKRCPSCGRAYSEMVKTCPSCGIDMDPGSRKQMVNTAVNQSGNDDRKQSDTQQPANAVKKVVKQRANPLYWIAYIIGAVIVGVLVYGTNAFGIGVIIGSIAMGAIVGLIPFLAAKSRGKEELAKTAMAVTIACNFLLGLILSIPSAVIFTVLALKK